MTPLRRICLLQDYDMAIHRGSMEPDAIMQAELNDLLPEQVELVVQQTLAKESHGQTAAQS